MNYDLLAQLCEKSGVSGYESEILAFIAEKIKGVCDALEYDRAGNLIAFKKGTKGSCGKKILYSCHADEVGFVITYIEDDGKLIFDAIGMSPLVYVGRRVLIGKNKIPGIIAAKPIHLLESSERDKAPEQDGLFIDIGAHTREEAEKLGVYADFAVFDSGFENFGEDAVKSKALDDRAGCAMLISLLERGVAYDSRFAFCTAEEIGLRGSATVAQLVNPDICINLECTTAGDIYGVSGAERTCITGGGAVVPFMDGSAVYHPALYRKIRALAEKYSVPCQTKTKIAGGTDAGSYTRLAGGCATIGIAVPTRYIHSAFGVAKKSDIDAAEKLLFAVSDNIAELELACNK